VKYECKISKENDVSKRLSNICLSILSKWQLLKDQKFKKGEIFCDKQHLWF
jgi:hypothetical protein